jgi:hypothetical protein
MRDGRTISLRDMSDVHLANTITRLETQAERETFGDAAIAHLSGREAAAELFPAYTYLVAERARRIETDRQVARLVLNNVN